MANEKVLSALHRARVAVKDLDWSLDGNNDKQGYRFLSHRKMKANMNEALVSANAELVISYDNYETKEAVGTMKQHFVVTATGTFFDVESGESLVFKAFGEGADSGDKAISKAQTNAYKTLIAQTFQISEMNEDGESVIASNDSIRTVADTPFEANVEIAQAKVIRHNSETSKTVEKRTDISDTQRKVLEKILFKAKSLSDADLLAFGGMEKIEEDYSDVKNADDALNFINAYSGVLKCQ
ncbi:MAG: hypothetical protein IIY21_04380 [Clostridiales bacterium]|nr:hypothetical protein [Clostridiales bacterium]MBQ1573877.1 hypothetical protein [Clostridiales bacterium]